MTLTAHFAPLPDMETLSTRWRALEVCADGSFFLGWTWIGNWLAITGARPELLVVSKGDQDVALALVGHAMQPRLFGAQATLLLNQSGDPAKDRGFIEYNGLLTARNAQPGVTAAAMAALEGRRDWRMVRLAGMVEGDALPAAAKARRMVRTDAAPAYHIDLDAVRGANGDYLSLLSANTRSQIKRSIKDHGNVPIMIERADSIAAVDAGLADMQALNVGRHADNAWDDAGFRAFARALAIAGLDNGEVELLHVAAGDRRLGWLLNFVYRGRAMNYQSAFAAPATPKDKPGLICHAAAVGYYADAGHVLYSLLAGKDRYKQSLGTGYEMLEWWTMERFSPRLEAEALLRCLLRRPASA